MKHSCLLLLALLGTSSASLLASQSAGNATPPSSNPVDSLPASPWMPWRFIGDAGNPRSPSGPGRVDVNYRIGRYEVTNRQYAEFLNAKASPADPLELYDAEMETHPAGGITRTGSATIADPFRYRVLSSMEQKPVNFVNFFDCVRFANWMHNGRGDGDTESGSYTLLGGTPIPLNGDVVLRNPGATVVLPTQNEWYKAGHYNPSARNYTAYATGSNAIPTPAAATAMGDVANPGPNVVNYLRGADWAGQDGNVTTVGSAGPGSESLYGCADMNGNVSEWNETIFEFNGLLYRKNRGGDYVLDESIMQPGHFGIVLPRYEASTIGFRVAKRVE